MPGSRSRGCFAPSHWDTDLRTSGTRYCTHLAGRAILVGSPHGSRYGVACVGPLPAYVGGVDTAAGVALALGAASFVVRVLIVAQRHLLLAGQRQADPVLHLQRLHAGHPDCLIFFCLRVSVVLHFSSYMVQTGEGAQRRGAVFSLAVPRRTCKVESSATYRYRRPADRPAPPASLPVVSLAVVPMDHGCAEDHAGQPATLATPPVIAARAHVEPPRSVPRWIGCRDLPACCRIQRAPRHERRGGPDAHPGRAVSFPGFARPAYA